MGKTYTYPAMFIADPEYGGYTVEFPDWEEAPIQGVTQGRTEEEAEWMAKDLLGLFCEEMERKKFKVPHFYTTPKTCAPGTFIKDITVDMDWYNGRAKPYRWRLLYKVWTQKIKRGKYGKAS